MSEAELPRWEMDSFYGNTTEALVRACAENRAEIEQLVRLFDREQIGTRGAGAIDSDFVETFEQVLTAFNQVHSNASDLEGLLYCLVSGDAANAHAQARLAEAREMRATLAQLDSRFVAWAGSLDVADLLSRSELAAAHRHALEDARIRAAHLMSLPEEALAAELSTSGANAWSRLRDDLEASFTAAIEVDGEIKILVLAEISNLLSSA